MTTGVLGDQPLVVRLLVKAGLLDDERLKALPSARKTFTQSVEHALVYGELADEADVARTYADHLGVAWAELAGGSGEGAEEQQQHVLLHDASGRTIVLGTVKDIVVPCQEMARAISESVCRSQRLLPVLVHEDVVDVVCIDPCDFAGLEVARVRAGNIVRPMVGTLSLLDALMASMFGEHDVVKAIGDESDPAADAEHLGDDEDTEAVVVDLQRPIPLGKDSQVIRIVNAILNNSIEEGASDIHIEPYEDTVRVRYRVDGKLKETSPPPRSLFVPTISRLKILAKLDIAERRIPQDGAIALKSGEKRIDLRVSTVPTIYGEKMVIRLLEKEGIPDRLQKLGFSDDQASKFVAAAKAPHGLMFVTGPTGSGKSTTLYCCLQLINETTENIVTVEDPVEYKFHGLNQVQVRPKVGLTFASALRSFLRQDPDKIMVGEVRDQETAEICMRAALTGHLVLSTLHTNNSLQVINRLVDMGIEPFLLGPALRLLEAQRLARRLCDECKQPYELPEDVAARFGLAPNITLYRAVTGNCGACRGRGNRGRVGIYEVVHMSEQLRDMVASNADQIELERAARAEGTLFLADIARQKVSAGLVGLEEVADYIQVDKHARKTEG